MIRLFNSEKELLKLLGSSNIMQVSIHSQSYCLVKSGNAYYLINPTCPHSNYPMSDAKTNAQGEVVCMWHSYRFDLRTGKEKFGRCNRLGTYPLIETPDGAFEVSLTL